MHIKLPNQPADTEYIHSNEHHCCDEFFYASEGEIRGRCDHEIIGECYHQHGEHKDIKTKTYNKYGCEYNLDQRGFYTWFCHFYFMDFGFSAGISPLFKFVCSFHISYLKSITFLNDTARLWLISKVEIAEWCELPAAVGVMRDAGFGGGCCVGDM